MNISNEDKLIATDRDAAIAWIWIGLSITAGTTLVLLYLWLPVYELVKWTAIRPSSFLNIWGQLRDNYFLHTLSSSFPDIWWYYHKTWFTAASKDGTFLTPLTFLTPPVPYLVVAISGVALTLALNPYSLILPIHGDARLANSRDIKRMYLKPPKGEGLIGPPDKGGYMQVLGDVEMGLSLEWIHLLGVPLPILTRKKQPLMFLESLSSLVAAPPGTGKTAAVACPTLLRADTCSVVCNDVKPELAEIVSGYRSTLGPNWILFWEKLDTADEKWPCWNPLSFKVLPNDDNETIKVIENAAAILSPDKDGNEKFWSSSARNAIAGFMAFIVWKVKRAMLHAEARAALEKGPLPEAIRVQVAAAYRRQTEHPPSEMLAQKAEDGALTLSDLEANPVGTWTGNGFTDLREEWIGQEPSIPMIQDWRTDGLYKFSKAQGEGANQSRGEGDPFGEFLKLAMAEIRRFGYSDRADKAFSDLIGSAAVTRQSIMANVNEALAVFNNPSVRERTSRCDIDFADVYGVQDPTTQQWKPITIYVSVTAVGAKTFGKLNGLFFASLMPYLISNGPNTPARDGRKHGPLKVLCVLDEFPKMGKITELPEAPDVTRSKGTGLMFIMQDIAQVEEIYGKHRVETLITTTAAKVILTQNNDQTAARFSKMIGNRTIRVRNKSRSTGLMQKDPLSGNLSEQYQGVPLFPAPKLMSLRSGQQIILVQKFFNRPIMAHSPMWFLDPELSKRGYNPRTKTGIPPVGPMPEEYKAKIIALEADRLKKKKASLPRTFITVSAHPEDDEQVRLRGGVIRGSRKEHTYEEVMYPGQNDGTRWAWIANATGQIHASPESLALIERFNKPNEQFPSAAYTNVGDLLDAAGIAHDNSLAGIARALGLPVELNPNDPSEYANDLLASVLITIAGRKSETMQVIAASVERPAINSMKPRLHLQKIDDGQPVGKQIIAIDYTTAVKYLAGASIITDDPRLTLVVPNLVQQGIDIEDEASQPKLNILQDPQIARRIGVAATSLPEIANRLNIAGIASTEAAVRCRALADIARFYTKPSLATGPGRRPTTKNELRPDAMNAA